jgi:hypothetical protein
MQRALVTVFHRSCIIVPIFILRIPLLVSMPHAKLKVALTLWMTLLLSSRNSRSEPIPIHIWSTRYKDMAPWYTIHENPSDFAPYVGVHVTPQIKVVTTMYTLEYKYDIYMRTLFQHQGEYFDSNSSQNRPISTKKVQPETLGQCKLVWYQVLTPAYHLKMGGATSSTPMRLTLVMQTTYRTHWSTAHMPNGCLMYLNNKGIRSQIWSWGALRLNETVQMIYGFAWFWGVVVEIWASQVGWLWVAFCGVLTRRMGVGLTHFLFGRQVSFLIPSTMGLG